MGTPLGEQLARAGVLGRSCLAAAAAAASSSFAFSLSLAAAFPSAISRLLLRSAAIARGQIHVP
jgi:hypothetical protein